jgi:predicted nuclease with RNAse H fold
VNGSSLPGEADALRVAGIDWATEAGNRALVELRLDRSQRQVHVERILSPVTEGDCSEATGRRSLAVVGVDVPFGWPAPFVEFVGGWSPSDPSGDLAPPERDRFSFRTTDLLVREVLGKWPLSVSSDRIGLAALAWARFVAAHGLRGQIDWGHGCPVTGSPTIIEVYPAATLASLVRRHRIGIDGYKKDHEVRSRLLGSLFKLFHVQYSPDDAAALASSGKDSDKTDAFVAALTALAYAGALGERVRRPSAEQQEAARREGWIFFIE